MKASTYREFWPLYLRDHSKAGTRALHIAGTLLGVGFLVAALTFADWRFAVAAPVVGYGLAWTGHFLVEHNRPATMTHPIWSLMSDFRMIALWATGRLRHELERYGKNLGAMEGDEPC